jgi:regulator of nucleoside diphosphate kinase
MHPRQIYITEFDMERLRQLVDGTRAWSTRDRNYLAQLEAELERAVVVPSEEIPPNVVTMNSEVRVKDVDTGKEMTVKLVFPGSADYERGKLSILAPIGTALIGYSTGDIVQWTVPAGVRRLQILDVLYQPEAAGDFHL